MVETEYEKEVRILLEAGAEEATDEEQLLATDTDRKITPS